jgi:hypothetical protein
MNVREPEAKPVEKVQEASQENLMILGSIFRDLTLRSDERASSNGYLGLAARFVADSGNLRHTRHTDDPAGTGLLPNIGRPMREAGIPASHSCCHGGLAGLHEKTIEAKTTAAHAGESL